MRRLVLLGALTTMVVARTAAAQYSHGITLEAVDDYSVCNAPTLTNRIANADGFRTNVLAVAGTTFTSGARFTNFSVWNTDFYDPEKTLSTNDDDTNNFDRFGDAIAYYSGHGVCDTGDTTQFCTSAAGCTAPPSGKSMPAICRRNPGDTTGTCSYTRMARQLAVGNCTSGDSTRGGRINYSGGNVRFGESINSGAWAGAGTNGGVNLAVIDSSCAEMWGREQEVWPAFGGAHMIAFASVLTGDTADVGDRGSAFAARYAANPFGSVAHAWIDSLGAVSNRNSYCASSDGTVRGGGFGYNGCGGNLMMSLDSTPESASWHVQTEDWDDLQFDAYDAHGADYASWVFSCNWDCNTYPGTL